MNFVKVLIPTYLRGSVHNEVCIKPGDTKGVENLSQISDQRETSIHHPQHLIARQVELCRKHRNSHLSFEVSVDSEMSHGW